jgi:hypothetical protein
MAFVAWPWLFVFRRERRLWRHNGRELALEGLGVFIAAKLLEKVGYQIPKESTEPDH